MRETKFRNMVYREQYKDWVTYFQTLQSLVENSDMDVFENVWDQYTGLKDKNGKEIYENDIVDWKGTLWLVNWDEKYARFVLIQLPNMLLREELNSDKEPYWEVISNIHENEGLFK